MTADKQFASDNYSGFCCICGRGEQVFTRADRSPRETYRCASCKASLREREQAQSLLSCYEEFRAKSIADLVKKPGFGELRIFEPGTIGPFRRLFKALPHYQQSDYYSEPARAGAPAELPHQDLEALTFPDASFDLVLTADILEHVRRPAAAFAEIARVLKPNGFHIFTVPLTDPLPPRSIARVDTSTEVDRHLLPEHYHGDGKGGRSLVYTDFGADIVDAIDATGMIAYLRRPMTSSAVANTVITVIARKP